MVVLAAACAAPPPPPVVAPQGEARFLVDPRTGWSGVTNPGIDRQMETAWRYVLAGDFTSAREQLDKLRAKNPDYAPADVAEAAIAIREKRFDDARAIVDRAADKYPRYTAPQIYEAEIDIAQNNVQSAYDRYLTIAAHPNAPDVVKDRIADLQTRLFDQLYHGAVTARDPEAIPLLRQALAINPAATAARILLVQKLVAQKQYDDARRQLDPLVNSGDADRPEVQEALAEIDVGEGRYQQAINRYERLTRRDPDGHFARRLGEIKEQFAEANMPPQFQHALDAESITRADLAVLMYWKVTGIRFAQDVPPPPIAIDIADVPGRDELVRAIALGIFQVDPITRRVNPFGPVNASALQRIAARILAVRGAACARVPAADPAKILASCGVDDPTVVGEEVSVSGRTAAALLDQIDRALH